MLKRKSQSYTIFNLGYFIQHCHKWLIITILFWRCASLNAQCINPTPPNTGFATGIINVSLNLLNDSTPPNEGYTMETDSPGVVIDTLVLCNTFELAIEIASNLKRYAVWIDWNGDLDFQDAEEEIANKFIYPFAFKVDTLKITPPGNATVGNVRMRVMNGTIQILDSVYIAPPADSFFYFMSVSTKPFDPCDSLSTGDVEDYIIHLKTQDMKADSFNTSQIKTPCMLPGANDQNILMMQLNVSEGCNPLDVTSFSLSTNGTTNAPIDISSASVWYTGSNPVFINPVLFGSTPTPSGVFAVNGSLTLDDEIGSHYFWLTYDITAGAICGDFVDAEVSSIVLDSAGSTISLIPNITAPTGNIEICCPVAEICDNSIDDDLDGLVDCFDPDCYSKGDCISNAYGEYFGRLQVNCKLPTKPVDPTFGLSAEWVSDPSFSILSYFTPPVGDIDNDGKTEILANRLSGTYIIEILDGTTGLSKYSIPGFGVSYGNMAIADVDLDGDGEIFIINNFEGNVRLYCYEHTAVNANGYTWRSIPLFSFSNGGYLSIADFNGDGIPEVFDNYNLFNAQTGVIMASMLDTIGSPIIASSNINGIAADVIPTNACPACSGLEFIYGTSIYTVDIINPSSAVFKKFIDFEFSEKYRNNLGDFPSPSNFQSVVADVNNNGALDIVSTGASRLITWNPRTGKEIGSFHITESSLSLPPLIFDNRLIRPVVDDVNNDGRVDFFFYDGGFHTFMIDNNMTEMWAISSTRFYESSGITNATIFDFEGDGQKELIIRPEYAAVGFGSNYLYVLNATTGAFRDSTLCKSGTVNDIGVQIGDFDNDGQIEILCLGDTAGGNNRKLVLYKSSTNDWVCGRSVWNQFSYHIVNINDDLSVPRQEQNPSGTFFNGSNIQAPFLDVAGGYACNPLADVISTINNAWFDSCGALDSVNLAVTFCNIGDEGISPNMSVSFYDNSIPSLISSVFISDSIMIDSCVTDTFRILYGSGPIDIFQYANDNGTNPALPPITIFRECDTLNNWSFRPVLPAVNPTPQINQDTVICDYDNLSLLAGGGDRYSWSPALGLSDTAIANPTVAVASIDTMVYWVRVTDTLYGCFADTFTKVAVLVSPTVDLGADQIICPGDTFTFSVSNTNYDAYLWSDGSMQTSLTVDTVGVYWVEVTDSVCFATDTVNVSLCNIIFTPNAFTPNGDGKNDVFRIRSANIERANLRIFDRWGNRVYDSQDLSKGWDGLGQSEGVYVYIVSGKFYDGKDFELKGNITLVR